MSRPSKTQEGMFAHYRRCQKAKVPCKMIVLKPRRDGASTAAQAIMYHHLQTHENMTAKLMANTDTTANEVCEIFSRLAENDLFDWSGEGMRTKPVIRKEGIIAELDSGSNIRLLSARGKSPGRGGEAQVANLTECADYPDSDAAVAAFLTSVRAAMDSPVGLAIADSTANGPSGWFYTTVVRVWKAEKAGTLALDDWHLIFVPWWEGLESTRSFSCEQERRQFEANLRPDEIEEMKRYGRDHHGDLQITLEHLHWRRNTIDQVFSGNVDKFRQEYCSGVMEAFLLNARTRFNQEKLAAMEGYCRAGQRGDFTATESGSVFIPDSAGQWEVWESPRLDCRYLLVLDSMTGEDQTSGKDPDYHAAFIIRAMFADEVGRPWRPMIVAEHHSRLEVGVLADEIMGAARHYATPGETCLTVVEVNNSGLALVTLLKEKECALFERRSSNSNTSEVKTMPGWLTSGSTKKTIIDHLAMWILNQEFDCPSKEVIAELRTFIVKADGSCEAQSGTHDDRVMALAIGLYNIGLATPKKALRRTRREPVDGYRSVAEVARERALAEGGEWGDDAD